jgi:hypothetical protein
MSTNPTSENAHFGTFPDRNQVKGNRTIPARTPNKMMCPIKATYNILNSKPISFRLWG